MWQGTVSSKFNLGLAFLLSALLVGHVFAGDPNQELQDALTKMCADIQSLIPPLALLLVMSAGVIYAAGQVGGAETRARAANWATSCVTGAFIGILISVIAPTVLSTIAGVTISCG